MPTADMNRRMAAVLCAPSNQTCADCPAKRPLWASFLVSPIEEGRNIGILCCSNCAQHHHFELGEKRTVIKYLKMAHEWELEDIEMMEEGGNEFVNSCFEAELSKDDFDKHKVFEDERAEEKRRGKFIKKKYKKLKYFDEVVYHQQILKILQKKHDMRKQRKPLEEDHRRGSRHDRKDKHSDSDGDLSRDSDSRQALKDSRAKLRGSSGDLRALSSHSRNHSPKRSSSSGNGFSPSRSRPQMRKSHSMKGLSSDRHRDRDRDSRHERDRDSRHSRSNSKDERRTSGSSFGGDSSHRSNRSPRRGSNGKDDKRESSARSARSVGGHPEGPP